MKRSTFALLLLLILFLPGCEMEQNTGSGAARSAGPSDTSFSEDTIYRSGTSAEDCMLCGRSTADQAPFPWGQNNIALISLNTFELQPVKINRYDGDQLIEEFAGFGSMGGGQSSNGGVSASLIEDHDRGYATGSVYFNDNEVLDIDKAAGLFCEECLNKILPRQAGPCFGVGAVNLTTKEVRIFAEDLYGFTLGDFYIGCDLRDKDGDRPRMKILIFYCPIRYAKEP